MKSYKINVNGKEFSVAIEEKGVAIEQTTVAKTVEMPVNKPQETPKKSVAAGSGEEVKSPMPGTVLKIKVANGATVKKGDAIIVLEAMKMENEIAAPKDGVVTITVNEGDKINSGDTIAAIA